jgi:hypothetical protein
MATGRGSRALDSSSRMASPSGHHTREVRVPPEAIPTSPT